MKLEDHIKTSIAKYPGLYLHENYEASRLAVLNQIFLVLGNGMEWAHTRTVKTGGYMVSNPRYYKRNGDYIRAYDKPYGVEKYTGYDINRMFNENWVRIFIPLDRDQFGYVKDTASIKAAVVWKGFECDVPKDLLSKSIPVGYASYIKSDKSAIDSIRAEAAEDSCTTFPDEMLNFIDPIYELTVVKPHNNKIKERGERGFYPYPFAPTYWPMSETVLDAIKPDWLQGMIDVKQAALEYYQNTPFGHKNMCSTWLTSEMPSKLYEFIEQGKSTEQVLMDYAMTLEDIPEFANVTLSFDNYPKSEKPLKWDYKWNTQKQHQAYQDSLKQEKENPTAIQKLGHIFTMRNYERDTKHRIAVLEKTLDELISFQKSK